MRFRDDRDEDDDDAWDDDSEADADVRDDDDDDDPTVPCPFCRRDILEDTPRCPHCERYLSPDDFARRSKPLWVLITAAVCLAIAIWLAFAI
jgi:hypothetical protein